MTSSDNIRRRIKELETARGAGAVNLTFADGSKQSFNLSRNDRLKVLLASFDLAYAARNPVAQPSSSRRAIEVARQIGKAVEVKPHDRLWQTVGAIVRGAEKDAPNCTSHARDPASG